MRQQTMLWITLYIFWSELIVFGLEAKFLLCEGVRYNKSTHLCCGGKVIPLRDHQDRRLSCCRFRHSTIEEKPYSEDTHLCCDIIRPKYDRDGKELHCCNGNRPYRKSDQICCGIHLKQLNTSVETECCDGKFYNINSQVCCENTLHQRIENQSDEEFMECCGDERYDSRNSKCEHSSENNSKIIRNELEDCNGQEYNMITHICCNDKVLRLPESNDRESYSCCGDQLFKPTHMRCCSNSHLIKKSQRCCGNESYDPGHQRCCSGVPNNILPQRSKCCGTTLIKAHDICCNGTHGDINFQCCGDKLIGRKEKCCEGRALGASEICCEEPNGATKQIKKRKVSDNACCIYRKNHEPFYDPYDQINQICEKGVIDILVLRNESTPSSTPSSKIPIVTKVIKMVDNSANSNVACNRKMTVNPLLMILVWYHLHVSA